MTGSTSTTARRTRAFTAGEVDRMVEAGILGDDEHVELLDGDLIRMSPQSDAHAEAVERLNEILVLRMAGRARVRPQLPISLPGGAEATSIPEPDLAVVGLGGRRGRPTTMEALLVVEVGVSSAGTDRTVKVPIYARGGVRELWLIDVEGRRVEILTGPRGDGTFTSRRVAGPGEPLALPLGRGAITLGDVLPDA